MTEFILWLIDFTFKLVYITNLDKKWNDFQNFIICPQFRNNLGSFPFWEISKLSTTQNCSEPLSTAQHSLAQHNSTQHYSVLSTKVTSAFIICNMA